MNVSNEHILVCLSSSPSNARIVRTAARLADAFKGSFTAVFVETPGFSGMEEADKKRLQANMKLAEELGAAIETIYGDDISFQIAEFARLSGVTRIVIGRSNMSRKRFWGKPALTEKLAAAAPNIDIYIIPDSAVSSNYYRGLKGRESFSLSLGDLFKSILILLAATLISFGFFFMGFSEANIITIYILGVLVVSAFTAGHMCSLIVSVLSVLVFNFFFTVPRYTFRAYDKDYPVTFAVMFIAALFTGTLAARLKSHARQSAKSAFKTKILFDTNQLLQKAETDEEIISSTAGQLMKLLKRTVIMYPGNGGLDHPVIYDYRPEERRLPGPPEEGVYYLDIRRNDKLYGVVGIVMGEEVMDYFEKSVVLSILGECALALENKKNAREKEQAAILAKNEKLRANLLRSISHDLRTPLTSISGNASNLISNGDEFDKETRLQIYNDIYDDSMWLISLVENLLAVTRIEEGRMNLRMSAELVDEVIAEALRHVDRRRSEHSITVKNSPELLLAKIDARLVMQVIINIVDNAIKYTPPGSHITVWTERQGDMTAVHIADDGPGIPDEIKPRIFDMFYSGANKVADSRRSLGLGLALCKAIITAHGGELTVSDHASGGAEFTFTLVSMDKEVEIHE